MINYRIITGFGLMIGLSLAQSVLSLPPPSDIPEEILRGEIVLEGRSPIDGKPVTLSEYVQLQEQLAQSRFPPNLSPEVRHQIFLLQLLKFLRTFTPLGI
ncbi:hypothetical protein [Gloeocapsa sp. PCC 73106]|uniref:hypothetical protein n=1 Tax=Gloeocapsa sp. PCC 73106 TaxID=102232 RepID=UPI0002ACDB12|nr:hypothetical protein [Gloeocapsa sp. PCC 73106]ELR96415.1 hypothetical protein GLO73106DRAFT_00002090 [Gloeocapsa sp. PCC 73106]